VLHISIWGIETFSGGLSGDGTEFWAPCGSVGPQLGGMECGWYGSVYDPWPVATIRRPTAWLCHWILASTL